MSDVGELYQDIILDHNRRPRNYGELAGDARRAEGKNPLCGDEVTVWVRLDGDVIGEVSFVGIGCAISRASASLMTAAVKGKSRAEAVELFDRVHGLVTGREREPDSYKKLGGLAALSGVSRYPARVKCASLAWHALRSAMAAAPASVSAE